MQRRPALTLMLASWFLPILVVLLADPPLDKAISAGTWVLIATCIAAATLGLLVTPRPLVDPPRPAGILLVLGLAAFGAAAGFLFWILTRNTSYSLEEVRNLLHEKAITMTRLQGYLFHAGGASSLIAIVLAAQTRRPLLWIAIAVVAAIVGWAGFMINFGARVYAMIAIALGMCGVLTRFPRQIFSLRGLVLGTAFLIPLYVVNVLFVEKRMESNFANPVFGESIAAKASTLIRVQDGGIAGHPFVVSAAWLLLQFSSDPVYYLDYYRGLNFPHHYGLYQFSLIAQRIPDYDWQEKRDQIDIMYEAIGTYTNVWGTSIRDAAIDFGEIGAVVMFLVMGWATGWMGATTTLGGRSLHLCLMMWLFYSPYNSPITMRPYQLSLFVLLAWHFVEAHRHRFLETGAGERPGRPSALPGGTATEASSAASRTA